MCRFIVVPSKVHFNTRVFWHVQKFFIGFVVKMLAGRRLLVESWFVTVRSLVILRHFFFLSTFFLNINLFLSVGWHIMLSAKQITFLILDHIFVILMWLIFYFWFNTIRSRSNFYIVNFSTRKVLIFGFIWCGAGHFLKFQNIILTLLGWCWCFCFLLKDELCQILNDTLSSSDGSLHNFLVSVSSLL